MMFWLGFLAGATATILTAIAADVVDEAVKHRAARDREELRRAARKADDQWPPTN